MISEKKGCCCNIERNRNTGMKTWHEKGVFGEYGNRMRIKQKHFGAVHLWQ